MNEHHPSATAGAAVAAAPANVQLPDQPHAVMPPDDAQLRPVERSYVHVLRIGWASFLLPLLAGVLALDMLLLIPGGFAVGGWATGVFGTLVLLVLLHTPGRQHARLAYTLGEDQLRVTRGYLFHTDTVVPFVRVQHIDVAQGPVERLFGLARLVVHTAGTLNSIVVLPGISRADAEAMRENVRRRILTDFA